MTKFGRDRRMHLGLGVGLPLLAAVALAATLRWVLPVGPTGQWGLSPAVVAGGCWAGQLWYVGYSLGSTRPGGEQDRLFGLANTLTLFRGALYAVVAGFAVLPPETGLAWAPALCYGVGIVLDKLDGTIARSVGSETDLGERLDVAFDTFGFVVAPVVAVSWGLLPAWYLSISAARYVFVGGIRWRRFRGHPVFDRPDSDLGKYLAGIQMAFLTVALVPAAPTGLVRAVAPVILAPSLAVFARDYLAVSGRLYRHTQGQG